MPHWLTEILDDAHPDVPWQPPARLPTPGDIRDAIARVDRTLVGNVSSAVARQCFAKLAMAFEPGTKLSGDEARLRMAVWLEACGDLGDALWIDATKEAIQTLKWMPKPAEFRALVSHQIDTARKQKRRLEAMAELAQRPPVKAPFVRESAEARLRGMINSFRKVGQIHRAAVYEHSLALSENRDPDEWATVEIVKPAPLPSLKGPPYVSPPESPQFKASLLKARIQFFRDMGMTDYVAAMERELAEIEAGKAVAA